MEPLDDDELKNLLHQWEAPDAPAGLRIPVQCRRHSWLRRLWTGTIPVPAPVGIALLLLLAGWVYYRHEASPVVITRTIVVPAPSPQISPPEPVPVRVAPAVKAVPEPALAGFVALKEAELELLRADQ